MFVKDKETAEITIYYRELGNGRVSVRSSLKGVKAEDQGLFKSAKFTLLVLNWKQSNDLLRESRRRNQVTQTDEIDWDTHRERRLVRALTAWDLKDAEGKDVPLTTENIFKMYPQIIDSLIYLYDNPDERE
jgi:hypothetical protein